MPSTMPSTSVPPISIAAPVSSARSSEPGLRGGSPSSACGGLKLSLSMYVLGGASLGPPRIRHADAALAQAVDSVAGGPGEAPLRIGILPTAAPSFMPQVLAAFATQRPLAGLRVHSGRNKQLLEMLRGRELDAVIGRLSDPDVMIGLSFEHLYAEPMTAVVRAAHPLAGKPGHAATATLAGCLLVLPLAGTLIRQLADGFLA